MRIDRKSQPVKGPEPSSGPAERMRGGEGKVGADKESRPEGKRGILKMLRLLGGRWDLSGLFKNPFGLGEKVTLGIDFGTRSIKMVLLRKRGKAIESVTAKVINRPMADVGQKGQIEEIIPLIKESVREIREEINNVVVSVQGPAVVVRRVDIPPMPKNELKSAIPWVIDKFLPYSVENAIFDYQVIGQGELSGELQLLIAVVERKWINRLMNQLKKIGLPPSSITIAPIALENLIHYLGIEKGSNSVAINIGERVTSINFFSGGRILFSRDIMTAGETITSSLTGKVTYKGEEFTIDPKMAEDLKCRYGVPAGDLPEFTDNGVPFASIQALIRPTIERLTTEIDRSIKYADRNYGISEIDRVLLTGGSAKLHNLKETLSTVLGTKVEVFDPAHAIEPIRKAIDRKNPTVFKKFGVSLAVALGLALEKGDGINLVSTGVQDIRQAALEKKLVRTAACLFLLILIGTSMNMVVKKNIDGKKLDNAYAMLESIQNDPNYDDVRTIQDRIQHVEQLLERFTINREFTPLLLKDISHRLPDGVILDDLTLTRKKVPKEPEGQEEPSDIQESQPGDDSEPKFNGWELSIEGLITHPMVLSEPVLTVFMLDLESSPFLKNPKLVSLEPSDEEGVEAMEFYIKCDVIRSGRVGRDFSPTDMSL